MALGWWFKFHVFLNETFHWVTDATRFDGLMELHIRLHLSQKSKTAWYHSDGLDRLGAGGLAKYVSG